MSPQQRASTTKVRSPFKADVGHAGIDTQRENSTVVRFGFRLPTLLLVSAKHVALDREAPLASLVRCWITDGLANGRDQRSLSVPTDGRLSEYPIMMPMAVRTSIRELSCSLQLSAAKLVRLWMAQGVALSVALDNNPQGYEALRRAIGGADAWQLLLPK